jgi:hypothetical protein
MKLCKMESPSSADVLAEDAKDEIAVREIENQMDGYSAWVCLKQARAGFAMCSCLVELV